jgi:hypothetical protein
MQHRWTALFLALSAACARTITDASAPAIPRPSDPPRSSDRRVCTGWGESDEDAKDLSVEDFLGKTDAYRGDRVRMLGYLFISSETKVLIEPSKRKTGVALGIQNIPFSEISELDPCIGKLVVIEGYTTVMPTRTGLEPFLKAYAVHPAKPSAK